MNNEIPVLNCYKPKVSNLFLELMEQRRFDKELDQFLLYNYDLLDSKPNIHLAVFIEPFLQYILEGKKTVESRFSINQCAPYKKVKINDIVILKRSGAEIVGLCKVSNVWFYKLDISSWSEIKNFKNALCAFDPSFWEKRKNASFATLMQVECVKQLLPFNISKNDRRGWVILKEETLQLNLLNQLHE